MIKRSFDLLISLSGLIIFGAFFLLIAFLIKMDSPGSVFFRQERVGKHGKIFHMHKFRTMVTGAEFMGLQITVRADSRVTRFGRVLRKYKLDELPQLVDVLFGDMSIVGPRPEVPHYVGFYPDEIRKLIQSVLPGITDPASIKFRNENDILSYSNDPERTYIQEILPIKLNYYKNYIREKTFMGDLRIILDTLIAILK